MRQRRTVERPRPIVSSIVFDSTALIHFARAGRLAELRDASANDRPVLLAEVGRELDKGAPQRPSLDETTKAWFKPAVELTEMTELAAFANYKTELGGGPERNVGEAAVLAWISVNEGIAIIDEEVARNIGRNDGLQVHGSLWLLIRSFRNGVHDRATVEGIVGDLLRTGMRLPFSDAAKFFPWARQMGVLP